MTEARNSGEPLDSIIEMPGMNGSDACREMRTLGCHAFIVGVTGNLMAEMWHFKERSANAVLPKPFKLSDLHQLWLEYGVLGCSLSHTASQGSKTFPNREA
jgi:CheY-like chemotaxis protein